MSKYSEDLNSWSDFFLDKEEDLDRAFMRLKTIKNSDIDLEIFPLQENIFNAFKYCPYDELKVVILGQDPYHSVVNGQVMANGFAFAQGIDDNYSSPPSLKNIISEVEIDCYNEPFNIERLELSNKDAWGMRQAVQGVLLLNTALTVEKGKPESHLDIWQDITAKIIEDLGKKKEFLVWILWGEHAKKYKKYIPDTHVVIEGVHPSPLSAYRGFFGSRPFSRANKALEDNGLNQIVW